MSPQGSKRLRTVKKVGPRQPLPIKAVLVQELREFAGMLGRTPTIKEVKKAFSEGLTHSEPTYYRVFGSFTAALKAAGLPLNYSQPFTRADLIEQLNNLAAAIGRSPSEADVVSASKNGTCARPNAFKRVFGTFYTALVEARLAQPITEELLVTQLQDLGRALGRLPSHADIDQAHGEGRCAAVSTFVRWFGSVRTARMAAGLGGKRVTPISDDEVLLPLKELAAKLGRSPTMSEVKAACRKGECYSANSYSRRFGTYHNALKAAGVKVTTRPATIDKGMLIKQLRNLTKRLGRVPTNDDIDQASQSRELSSRKTYVNHFGSMRAASEEARLDRFLPKTIPAKELSSRNVSRRRRYTPEQLVEDLQKLTRKLKRIQTKLDINRASRAKECAGANTYVERFGGMNAVVKVGGLKKILIQLEAEEKKAQEMNARRSLPST
jgi:hypothetical protein